MFSTALASVIAFAIAILLLSALLLSGCIFIERTSSSEIRVEFFGTAFKLNLADTFEFFGSLTDGLKLWCTALPDTLSEFSGMILNMIGKSLSTLFEGSYSPSGRLC